MSKLTSLIKKAPGVQERSSCCGLPAAGGCCEPQARQPHTAGEGGCSDSGCCGSGGSGTGCC